MLRGPSTRASYGDGDDFWYGPPMQAVLSGVSVSADNAMQVSALSACVRLISGTQAKLPIHEFETGADGDSRSRRRGEQLEYLLNVQPNRWQTAFDFRRQMTANLCLTGNAVAQKKLGADGEVEQLIPWHPTRVSWEQLDDSEIEYKVASRSGPRTFTQDQVFHLRDLSIDGVTGLSRIEQARQGIGLSMAAEMFAASYFGQGGEPPVALTSEGNLNTEARKRVLDSWKQSRAGVRGWLTPFVGEGGLKVEKLGNTNKDSQLLELRGFQVSDMARLFGVPPHLIGDVERSTSWGTGIEQQNIGFLVFSMMDWLVLWEQAIRRDLIVSPLRFVEHKVEALLRVDFKTRMDGYAQAIINGIMSPDEVRQRENLEPRSDGRGGEFLRPANMVPSSDEQSSGDTPQAAAPIPFEQRSR